MDKELEKRQRKKENLHKRMEEVKPEQVNLVRFVDVQWEVMEVDEDGNWHRTGREHGQGLQVENRVHMVKGPYKMVNRRTFRITKVYDGIPEWATEELKERYRREWVARGLDKRRTPTTTEPLTPPVKTPNSKLSTRAMELLAVMQSFPPNKQHSIGSIKASAHAARTTVHKCLDELEAAGYIVKKQIGQHHGKPGREVYILSANQQTPLSSKTRKVSEPEDDLPPW